MSFKSDNVEYDDSGFRVALRDYLNWKKNIDPDNELKRRAKNIGMKLIRIYVKTGAQKKQIIAQVRKLGYRVKTRKRIKLLKLPRKEQIALEIKARANASGFTATGWFPAVFKLGGNPKQKSTGKLRGTLNSSLGGVDPWVELVNQQAAAGLVAERDGGAIQKALDEERDDILIKVIQYQERAAARNGFF